MRNLGHKWQRYQMMPLTNRNWNYELRMFIGSRSGSDDVLYENDSILAGLKKDFKIFSKGFTIGNVPSAYLEFTVCKRAEEIPKNAQVRLEIRIVGEQQGNTDWVAWGTYFVDTRDIQRDTITLKCYDRMLFGDQDFWNSYASFSKDASAPWLRPELSKEQIMDTILYVLYPSAAPDRLRDRLDSRMGLDKIYLPDTKIPPEASVRDVLSWVGMANGMNWVISDEDRLRGVVLKNYDINSVLGQNDSLLMMTFSNNPQIIAVSPTQFSVDELNKSIVEIMGAEEGSSSTDYPAGAVSVISSDTVQYQALVQVFGDSKTTNVDGEKPRANYWVAGDESKTPVMELTNPLISSLRATGEAQVECAFSRIKDYNYRGIVADTVFVDPAVEFGDSIVLGQYVFEIANISWFGMLAANIESPLDGNLQSEFPFKAPQAKTFQRILDNLAGTKALLELNEESIRAEINEITEDGGTLDTKLLMTSGQILSTVSNTYATQSALASAKSEITQTANAVTMAVNRNYNNIQTFTAANGSYPPASADKNYMWENTNQTGYYWFWDAIANQWQWTKTPSIGSLFTQTADGFRLSTPNERGTLDIRGNVKLTGNITWNMTNSPVKTQYSVNSNGPWTATQNSAHRYMRMSFDGGGSWNTPTQIVGTNGSDADVTRLSVFNALTNNGTSKGFFTDGSGIYANIDMLHGDLLEGKIISGGTFRSSAKDEFSTRWETNSSNNSINFYYGDNLRGVIKMDGVSFTIESPNNGAGQMILGNSSKTTFARGTWNFSECNPVGLKSTAVWA